MKNLWKWLGVGLVAASLPAGTVLAAGSEVATVDSATEVLQTLTGAPRLGIPPALLHDAKGVAVIPHVLKAGFFIGGRHGRGVVLVRQPDGTWGNPVFITLTGGGIGWQVGVQATDLVLVFKTSQGLERILQGRGKVTLGADVGVAAGPVGRQAEAATDVKLKAEIYSYSRSRGLFAGLSVEGAGVVIDFDANEAFYHVKGGRPADVLAVPGIPLEAVNLKVLLNRLSGPPAVLDPPPVVVPPVITPAPPVVSPPASPVPLPPVPPLPSVPPTAGPPK